MQWFEKWFDSKYYHLLYSNHDFTEAESFITRILSEIRPSSNAKILDLACGKGRLAISLANRGFNVVGTDLSNNSISHAQQFKKENLSFVRHDMRKVFRQNYFDIVFNFFTSFGYFDTDLEHSDALNAVYSNLKPGAYFVIDFLNAVSVASKLVPFNEGVKDGIKFELERKLEDGYFIKNIRIFDGSDIFLFQEKVRAFDKEDITLMLEDVGFVNLAAYGNYQLDSYSEMDSPRLIIIAQKKS